jgi:hypothetical protein
MIAIADQVGIVGAVSEHSPGLHGALLAAKAAGYSHVNINGTLVETDRCATPGPTPGGDLWWSGKHDTKKPKGGHILDVEHARAT